MAKLVAIAVVATALLGGAGAGHFLRPAPAEGEAAEEDAALPADGAQSPEVSGENVATPSGDENVVTFKDIFVVPILRDGLVWSHVVLTLGISSGSVSREDILLREPLLRDAFMETLFVHGSLGGFDGDFTEPLAMNRLRRRLDDAAIRKLGDPSARALIVSMARQGG